MSYDEDAVLLTVTGSEQNRNGFGEDTLERTEVFVGRKKTMRTEAYKAMQEGHTVAVTLALDASEYEAAIKNDIQPKYAEYQGIKYRILRVYGDGSGEMELILQEG